jgi:hypothetical protein
MRWFVVAGSHPASYEERLLAHAQPPGPGLPMHAPSVNTIVLPGLLRSG